MTKRAYRLAAATGVALVVVVGACATALGQTSGGVAAAKKLFETGLKLYGEGSYRQALAAFLKANELAPRASIQRNIAQCHRDLKDFAAAYDAYQTLLAKYGSTMSASDRRAVERAIEELALLTGTIRVAVTEPGAAVAIDGHDAGTTPLASAVRSNLGPHAVTVTKAGFETLTKQVKLDGGDEAVVAGPLAAEVTTGHLAISAPAGSKVEVMLDGQDVGAAPWEGDVAPGTHVVEARGADQFSQPKKADVAKKGRTEVALELVARTGRVQIDTHTADASIAIDGNAVGRGVWEGALAAGEHELAIRAPGFLEYRRAFVAHAGETFVEDAHLLPSGGGTPGAEPRYEGIYTGMALLGLASPSDSTNGVAQSCPSPSGCQTSNPIGAGLAVRVGYGFGWIAVEALALGTYDFSKASLQYGSDVPGSQPNGGVARTEDYAFHRFGGGGAIGVRVANEHPHLRVTAGALFGVVEKANIYTRSANATGIVATNDYTSDTTSYTAPLLALDAGVLVGWTNGPKFHVGGVALFEFVGDPVVAPPPASARTLGASVLGTPPLQVAAGTQVFLGPMIGFDFGL